MAENVRAADQAREGHQEEAVVQVQEDHRMSHQSQAEEVAVAGHPSPEAWVVLEALPYQVVAEAVVLLQRTQVSTVKKLA